MTNTEVGGCTVAKCETVQEVWIVRGAVWSTEMEIYPGLNVLESENDCSWIESGWIDWNKI